MKPQLLLVPLAPAKSFSVRHDIVPYFFNRWHYHTEVELIHIQKGSGTQFIGDNISRFEEGDILLIGSNLPHYWRCDDIYFEDNAGLAAEAKVAHFNEDFLGDHFLELPENMHIKKMLQRSRRGIKINGFAQQKVKNLLDDMLLACGTERILRLVESLHHIACLAEPEYLSSTAFNVKPDESESQRINDIYQYSIANFKNKISLEEISEIAHVSPNSFCRYFKSQTNKTYSKFLIEIRIGHACKLLIEDRYTISNVCFESGFNNFSNFNRYFRIITGKSPLEYRKSFAKTN